LTDERDWVRRLMAGDDSATREFVSRVEPVVQRVVRTYAANGAQSDDWTQDVFLRLIERLDRFDHRAPLEHWVAKVALRVCLDQLRAVRREREAFPLVADAQRILSLSATDDATTAAERQRTAKELVVRLLEQLAPEDRVVIQLLDLEELSVAQVAELLDRSASWVKVRAHRARRWLEDTCRKLVED
jgi:RNA polymerase sigma factor (sigma-70 family)